MCQALLKMPRVYNEEGSPISCPRGAYVLAKVISIITLGKTFLSFISSSNSSLLIAYSVPGNGDIMTKQRDMFFALTGFQSGEINKTNDHKYVITQCDIHGRGRVSTS